ncbi:ankyrin repeat-containing domain protein [Apodospora peruviana]|uniref:Ankyrin repeat-containing domain protein n=1 Tax=Apodospora peruviana TaxID=516989 RepID=A0AAE0HWJ3_9PEZI|nr:ankyrin repeat-containing domain protein [Apodospora peruviana]
MDGPNMWLPPPPPNAPMPRSGRRRYSDSSSSSNSTGTSGDDEGKTLDEALLEAADNGSAKKLSGLLAKGANAAAKDDDSNGVLHMLLRDNDDPTRDGPKLELVRMILEALTKEQIDSLNDRGESALYIAIDQQRVAEINIQGEEGTPLHVAAYKGLESVARLLLAKEQIPMYHLGRIGIISKLLSMSPATRATRQLPRFFLNGLPAGQEGADLNLRTKSGRTALHIACHERLEEVLDQLLAAKAETDTVDCHGWTPLHDLIYYFDEPSVHIVRQLVQAAADVDAVNSQGSTPLHIAVANGGDLRVVEELLTAKREMNIFDKLGWTPLKLAQMSMPRPTPRPTRRRYIEQQLYVQSSFRHNTQYLVAALLGKRFWIKRHSQCPVEPWRSDRRRDPSKRTALHRACLVGSPETTAILMKHGANSLASDNKGRTTLHKANAGGHAQVVRRLLGGFDDPASVDLADNDGMTALHWAFTSLPRLRGLETDEFELMPNGGWVFLHPNTPQVKHYASVAEAIFAKSSTSLVAKNRNGETPLHLAAECPNFDGVGFLLEHLPPEFIVARDNNGATALCTASKRINAIATRQLLEVMETADFGHRDLTWSTLKWAAEDEATHDIVCLILEKYTAPGLQI